MTTEAATTKGGKPFTKVTVDGKYVYDWNGVVKKAGLEDGTFVKAIIDDGKYAKLKSITAASKEVQAMIGKEKDIPVSENVVVPQRGNPANCARYLQLKLACEFALGGKAPDNDQALQWLENCYKKIKSLWESE